MNYDDWNRALADTFFNYNQSHKPVYLHVDDELLQEITEQYGMLVESAREHFIQAVIARVRYQDDKTQPFFKFLRWRMWETLLRNDPTTPPPFIAFLGFCVLAAVDMTSDESLNVTSSNYYVRLNVLLGKSGRGQPQGFDAIEQAWKRLNQWLRDDLQEKFGRPTANNSLYGRHVGYPISQALIRRTDQEQLPDFFRWCGLEPHEESVDAAYFKQHLQLWVHRTTCSFSRQLQRIFEIGQEEHIQQIAEMTLAQYKAWDGSATTRKGERSSEIVIQLNRVGRSFELALHPRAPQDFPEGLYGTAQLHRSDDPAWFEPLDKHHVQRWLAGDSLDLSHDRYRVVLRVRQIVPLRNDITSDLGGWIACSRVGLGEKHLVLCHCTLKKQVGAYFDQYAENGWYVVTSRDPIYANWVCFGNVRVTKRGQEEPEELDCLVPLQQVGIRLSGGLKLKRDVWLRGGEPEVIISAESELPVYLDDEQIATAVAGSTIINLQKYNLSEGIHTTRVGSYQRTLALSSSGNDLLGQHRMQLWGYPFERIDNANYRPLSLTSEAISSPVSIPLGRLYIAGMHILHSPADPPPPRQHLLILPYGARNYIILGRHIGEIFEPQLPTHLPKWKAESYLQGYKQIVPFEPQWLISISHRGNFTLRPLGRPKKALSTVNNDEMANEWRKWAGRRNLKHSLNKRYHAHWLQYCQIARGVYE